MDVHLDEFAALGVEADSGHVLGEPDSGVIHALPATKGNQPGVHNSDLDGKASEAGAHYGVIGDIDPNDLREAGWAILFGASVSVTVRQALEPLLRIRRELCGEGLFKIFEGESGYFDGDSATDWLKRRGVRLDVVDPALGVPFYLLIVAPPEEIPFAFQYGIDLYWGVGRLWFDTADQFRLYAESVVAYEKAVTLESSRSALLFAPVHDGDRATELFRAHVADPLSQGPNALGTRQKFGLTSLLGESATKGNLLKAFEGGLMRGIPSLLFLGGHGKCFRIGDERQAARQGALICQEWEPGTPAVPDACLAGSDLCGRTKLHGSFVFLFACYGGGWPVHDGYARVDGTAKQISERPGLARLPQALLSHENGGALAVLAHIDRAWASSFAAGGRSQSQGFRDVMGRVMRGDRIGNATDQFNLRWAALSVELAETLEHIRLGASVDLKRLSNQWTARDDARNYVVLGDPAVRLRVEDLPSVL